MVYSFMVLWFHGFIVLWLYGFLVSKIYNISISCFQEDTDPIFKICKHVLNSSSFFSAPVFSEIVRVSEFHDLDIYENCIFFKNGVGCILGFVKVSWSLQG